MVGVVLIAQPGANNIQIADEFYKRLEVIKKNLPTDIKAGIGYDITTFIKKSILEVRETILIAFCLVVLIIFLFLRDWRTTLIPYLQFQFHLLARSLLCILPIFQ